MRTSPISEYPNASRIVLGCGLDIYEGWLSTNRNHVNVTVRDDFLQWWRPNTIATFLAEHVWEHLIPEESNQATRNVFEFLRPGGRFRIAVPDGYNPDPVYQHHVRPFGAERENMYHRQLYTYKTLSEELQSVGFKVQLLEWYCEGGLLHCLAWDLRDGPIKRTSKNPRRKGRKGISLLIDAFKPDCPT